MKKVIAFGMVFAPMFVFAQSETYITNIMTIVGNLLNLATVLITAMAVVWFMWGVFIFILSAGDEEKRKLGRNRMIAGIIGIAVIVSVWGLVTIITNTFGVGGGVAPSAIELPA